MYVAIHLTGVYGTFKSLKEARDYVMSQKYDFMSWSIRRLNPITH
jgi:hypothetical protein